MEDKLGFLEKESTKHSENWVKSEYGLPEDGSPVIVWDKHNQGMLWWSAESKEKMHADFKRLGFSHWRHLNPPD